MNHRSTYTGTAMVVWLITSIICFNQWKYNPDVEVISLKSFIFVLGGVFVLSNVIGYICTMIFGFYISKTANEVPSRDTLTNVQSVGKAIKYVEAVLVFLLTIYCFKALFDL